LSPWATWRAGNTFLQAYRRLSAKGGDLLERAHLQKMSEEVVVFFVGADKVPNNSIAFFYTYYSIV